MDIQIYQILFFLAVGQGLIAQDTVWVEITDESDGQVLPYAEIRDGGGKVFYASDKGLFKAVRGTQYEFRYLGYQPQVFFMGKELKDTVRVKMSMSTQLLNQAVVTGNRSGERLMEAVTSLDVMPSSMFTHRSTPDISQLMNRMPGVQVVDGQISIRGGAGYAFGAGSRVALLLNGVPMLQPDVGTISWNDLPIELIRRTEIVKTSATVLYGSAALNGVVQMQTWPNQSDTSFSELLLASRGVGHTPDAEKQWYNRPRMSYWGHATHTHLRGKFQWQGSVRWENERNHLRDYKKERGRLSYLARYRPKQGLEYGVHALANRSKSSTFLYWRDANAGANIGDSSSFLQNDVTRIQIDPYFKRTYRDGRQHHVQGRIFYSQNEAADQRGSRVQQYLLNYQYNHPLDQGRGRWIMGATAQAFESKAELFGDKNLWAYNAALFSQAGYRVLPGLRIISGLRLEYNGQFPGIIDFNNEEINANSEEWQPLFSAGVNYELNRATAFSFHWGEGYRFPTIAEKFIATPLGPTLISPNPELISEIGETYNLGIKQIVPVGGISSLLRVDLFLMQYDDMIEFGLQNPLLGFQAINIGDTDIRGLEISALGDYQLSDISGDFLISYTYIDPSYRNFNEDIQARSSVDKNILKYRVQHQFTCQGSWNWKSWQVGLSGLYNSDMVAIDALLELFVIPGLQPYRQENAGAFWRWDLSFGYVWSRWRVLAELENVFNTEYSLRPGLLEAPRSLTIQLQYQW
jgi:iron complex outermembrane receptor protein